MAKVPHAFPHEMMKQTQCISPCDMKKHWLVEMATWEDGHWEIPHVFLHEMKRQMRCIS
jgi:hypothetical protein